MTLKFGIEAGHDAQDRGFARAVLADDPDFGAGVKAEVYVFEHLLLPVEPVDAVHVEDEFFGHITSLYFRSSFPAGIIMPSGREDKGGINNLVGWGWARCGFAIFMQQSAGSLRCARILLRAA
jgi:hypothetical protein